MSLAGNYDWIVLGDHPGALLSANLVAKLGLSVLVLPKCRTQKVLFSQEGQCLDPEPNFVIGLGEPESLLREILERVSAIPQGHEPADIVAEGSIAQALTPERRILLSGAQEFTARELERELAPGEERELVERALSYGTEVSHYWRQLPSKLTLDLSAKKRKEAAVSWPASWKDLLRKLQSRRAPTARTDLMEALGEGLLSHVSEHGSSAEWVHALALGRSGGSYRGGMSAYRKLLMRSAKSLGATVLDDAECRRIFLENRRFVGIQVSVSGNMIGGTGCLLGSSVEEFSDRFSFTGHHWRKRERSLASPGGWRYTVALTIREEALIPGMSRRMIWKEAGAPALEIETADPSEYGTKEPDHKLIFLRTILPFTEESLSPEFQRMTSARMFRLATEIIPFLEYHVTRVFPDFRVERKGSSEAEGFYRFESLSAIPENLRVYPGDRRASRAASGAAGLEGLFVAAGESLPRLGSFGPTVAAVEATAWVAHRSGLAGPL